MHSNAQNYIHYTTLHFEASQLLHPPLTQPNTALLLILEFISAQFTTLHPLHNITLLSPTASASSNTAVYFSAFVIQLDAYFISFLSFLLSFGVYLRTVQYRLHDNDEDTLLLDRMHILSLLLAFHLLHPAPTCWNSGGVVKSVDDPVTLSVSVLQFVLYFLPIIFDYFHHPWQHLFSYFFLDFYLLHPAPTCWNSREGS